MPAIGTGIHDPDRAGWDHLGMRRILDKTVPRHAAPRSGRLRPDHWTALAVLSCVSVIGGFALAGPLESGGATSGWNVATVPGTGVNDLLLGTTCANAVECWGVGVSISSFSGGPSTTYSPLVESWNGTSWSLAAPPALPSGDGGGIFDVACASGADCWGVGTLIDEASGQGNPVGSLVVHWNGSTWSVAPSPTPTGGGVAGAILESVSCAASGSCMAVGYTLDGNGTQLTDLVEHWDGTAWSIVPGAATGQSYDQLTGVQCLGADDCWAVGNTGPAPQNSNFLPIFPGGAPSNQGLVEHWNGSTWVVVPSANEPSPGGGYLSGIECTSDSNCWASGAVTDGSGRASGVLMERWNGAAWADLSSSVPTPSTAGGAILSSISCTGPTRCWAVGSAGQFGGNSGNSGNSGGNNFQPSAFVESWNGASWSVEPSPDVTALSYLNGVSCVTGVGCVAAGSTAVDLGNSAPSFRPLIEQMSFPPSSSQGLVLGARDGGVFTFGTATFAGSMGGQRLNAPVVGIAGTPDGHGYWLVASDGGVFSFGDAGFYGSTGGLHLNKPVVGMASTPDGHGYWLVASDGGVFSFGDAGFDGSMGGRHLNAPVVGMAAADQGGYWLVASDGGVFTFGDAGFFGSAGALHLDAPVTGMAGTPNGGGYWLVASDGGVFTFGNAGYQGSVPGQGIVGQPPVVGIARTPTGSGYWLTGSDGAVYAYGDATFLGSLAGHRLDAPVVGLAPA